MKQRIQQDLKAAMLAKRPIETGVLRAVLTALTNFEKENDTITEADCVQIIRKAIKQREESARIYNENGRIDLYGSEMAEVAVLEDYMPKVMTHGEVCGLIGAIIVNNNLELTKKNMGQIVKLAVAASSGATDGKTVSSVVNKLITELEA